MSFQLNQRYAWLFLRRRFTFSSSSLNVIIFNINNHCVDLYKSSVLCRSKKKIADTAKHSGPYRKIIHKFFTSQNSLYQFNLILTWIIIGWTSTESLFIITYFSFFVVLWFVFVYRWWVFIYRLSSSISSKTLSMLFGPVSELLIFFDEQSFLF